MTSENCLSSSQINTADNEELVIKQPQHTNPAFLCAQFLHNEISKHYLMFFCFSSQVRPKVELLSLLKHAGANKELYTMKEVDIVYLPFVTSRGTDVGII